MTTTATSTTTLHRLFNPRSVAVVGASPKGGYGLAVLENMRGIGFDGELRVVHPRLDSVLDVQAAPSLSSLDLVPDAIVVAVPASAVPGVLAEAADLGVGGAVVFASGFAELGDDGVLVQQQIQEICRGRLPVIGPNCLGLASFRGRAAMWAIDMPFVHADARGTVAIAAQSGNMATTTMMSGRLPQVAYAASLGNQAVVDLNDCFEYYLEDAGVRVVALIMEGLSDLQRFRALALRAVSAGVAVVALKVGRSPLGVAATTAHTGTLAGRDGAYDALFRQTGVIRVDDLDELVATCSLLGAAVRPQGSSLGLFASSGGECGLFADLAHDEEVTLPDLDEHTSNTLRTVLPDYGNPANPFDLTAGGWGDSQIYETTARAMAASAGVDIVAFVGDAPTLCPDVDQLGWPEMISGVGRAADGTVPMALITTTTDTDPALAAMCSENGLVLLAGAQQAMRAIRNAGQWHEQAARIARREISIMDVPPPAQAVRQLLDGQPAMLSETTAKDLLIHYGISAPAGESVVDADAAVAVAERIGFPVVCKLEADDLAHKSDIGGVVVGLTDAEQLRDAVARVLESGRNALGADAVRGVRIEVAAVTTNGVEMIVGGHNDPSGTVVVLGAGGVLTELLSDAMPLLWPFGADEVRNVLDRLHVRKLLAGYRGAPAVDLDILIDTTVRVGQMLAAHPEIAELDINPLLCTPDGVIALDALVRLRTA